MINERRSGVLLHITSLPAPYGIGNLGPAAYQFANFMSKAGLTYWQLLPPEPGGGSQWLFALQRAVGLCG